MVVDHNWWMRRWARREVHTHPFVFEAFSFILFLHVHSFTVERSWDADPLCNTFHIVESSTNFRRSLDGLRSLTIIKKGEGPSFVPCGTPAWIWFCSLLDKKSPFQLIRIEWTDICRSFLNRTVWSVLSKAFESRRRILSYDPVLLPVLWKSKALKSLLPKKHTLKRMQSKKLKFGQLRVQPWEFWWTFQWESDVCNSLSNNNLLIKLFMIKLNITLQSAQLNFT